MNYKKTYIPKEGYTYVCKMGECSFKMLEFGIIMLSPGKELTFKTADKETAFIMLFGICNFSFDGKTWDNVGRRKTVFDGKATAVYMPRNKTVLIKSLFSSKIAVCQTPVDEDTEPTLINQADVKSMVLGQDTWVRDTHFIVDDRCPSKRLYVGESWCKPGNWAGFPPHKHDVNNMPFEGIAEELYYFMFNPEQGFALQALYTSDKEIDEAYIVRNDELVEFPKGYHPIVGAPGYNTWFLWAMVGEHKGFYRSSDPKHEWIGAVENLLKQAK